MMSLSKLVNMRKASTSEDFDRSSEVSNCNLLQQDHVTGISLLGNSSTDSSKIGRICSIGYRKLFRSYPIASTASALPGVFFCTHTPVAYSHRHAQRSPSSIGSGSCRYCDGFHQLPKGCAFYRGFEISITLQSEIASHRRQKKTPN